MFESENSRPIIGHHSAWGFGGGTRRIQPYHLTPGATETMRVRVREKIDINGIGIDVIEMEGVFIVRRDHPQTADGGQAGTWNEAYVRTEFRSLELVGESPVFGTVRVHLDPEFVSNGLVEPGVDGSQAGKCKANLHPVIELPDLEMRLTTGGQPVVLGSKVIQIPPVGDVARSEGSVALYDESQNVIGELVSSDVEVGEVISSIQLGATFQTAQRRSRAESLEASGIGFFAEVPGPDNRWATSTSSPKTVRIGKRR